MTITPEQDIELLKSVLDEQAGYIKLLQAKLAAETDRCVAVAKRVIYQISDDVPVEAEEVLEAAMREGQPPLKAEQ